MLIETIILLVVGRRIAKICEQKGHEPRSYVVWTGVLCIGGGLLGLGIGFLLFGFHIGHGWRITSITLAGLLVGVALSFMMAHRLEDLSQPELEDTPLSKLKRKQKLQTKEMNRPL